MTTVAALAAMILVVAEVTTGLTVAICTAVPLLSVFVVTIAVKLPANTGNVEKVTISSVAVAEVTVPTALLLKTTVLFAAAGSNPNPLMVTVVESAARLAVLVVTTGLTVATWTGEPFTMEFVATTAVNGPAVAGLVERVIVKAVAVALDTVPTAPSLNVTVLFAAVVSNPNPLIVSVVAVARIALEVVLVITGITVATWVDDALACVLEVTVAERLPASVGAVVMVTVSDVAEAEAIVPTAPLSKTTELFDAVASKPKPSITMDVALAAKFAVDEVTKGITVAAWAAVPLLELLVVTMAVKLPAEVGLVENVTVNVVGVAAVTAPTAPLLNATVLLATMGLKPKPLILILEAFAARFEVLTVTTGVTVAT